MSMKYKIIIAVLFFVCVLLIGILSSFDLFPINNFKQNIINDCDEQIKSMQNKIISLQHKIKSNINIIGSTGNEKLMQHTNKTSIKNEWINMYNKVIHTIPLTFPKVNNIENIDIKTGLKAFRCHTRIRSCCGLGHALTRVLPTMVYTKLNGDCSVMDWTVMRGPNPVNIWFELFNDDEDIVSWKYDNEFKKKYYYNITFRVDNEPPPFKLPYNFASHSNPIMSKINQKSNGINDVLHQYFVLKMLLNFRQKYINILDEFMINNGFHNYPIYCTHIRTGNGEIKDFEEPGGKARLIKDFYQNIKTLIDGIIKLYPIKDKNNDKVMLFVTSDDHDIIPKINDVINQNNTLKALVKEYNINVFKRDIWLPKHGQGTRFLDWTNKGAKPINESYLQNTNNIIKHHFDMYADMVIPGHCDGLFLTTYSSFTLVPSMLTLLRDKPVCFMTNDKKNFMCYLDWREFKLFTNEK